MFHNKIKGSKMYKVLFIMAMIVAMSAFGFSQIRDRVGNADKLNKITETMSDELKLSAEQKEKIVAINNDFVERIKKVRNECQGDKGQMREVLRDINNERELKYKEILSESQWQQYLTFKEEMKKSRKSKGRHSQYNWDKQSDGNGKNR
jgi:isopenicillin N synthase-like dioxygenase